MEKANLELTGKFLDRRIAELEERISSMCLKALICNQGVKTKTLNPIFNYIIFLLYKVVGSIFFENLHRSTLTRKGFIYLKTAKNIS